MSEPIIIRQSQQPDSSASEIVDIEVIPKELFIDGQLSIMKVLRSGSTEGLTVGQIAEMAGTSERAVWGKIRNHAIRCDGIGSISLRTLKDAGVLPFRSARAAFVPQESVQQLLKLIKTPEAWAIYYQLWNNSAKLEEVEKKLLETAGQLKAALDRSAIAEVTLRIQAQRAAGLEIILRAQEQEIAQLKARLQASVDFIEGKGKSKKSYRHRVVDIEFAGVNIFEGPQYRVTVKKKEVAEMDVREKEAFGLQRGISSIRGIAGSMQVRAARLDVANPEIMGALRDLSAASDAAYHRIIPDAGRVFGLKDGMDLEYLN